MPYLLIAALAVTALTCGASASWTCLLVLCPGPARTTTTWLKQRSRLCFLVGLLSLVVDLALALVLKWLVVPWLVLELALLALGMAALSAEVGRSFGLNAWRGVLAGQGVLTGTLLLPLVGWVVLTGAGLSALGSATLSSMRAPGL